MGWFNTGFESSGNAYDFDDGLRGPRRYWMPADTEKRVIFLDDNPTTYWEHNFKHNGSWKNWEPCKNRNRMADDCAVCDRYPDRKPSFIGMLTVINMTAWESKGGREYCFGRELFVSKLGGKDKPGMLKKLERLKKQHGGLTGCIFDIYRSGGKAESVGDEFTLVEKINPSEVEAFGKRHLKEWVEHVNEQIEDPEKYVTLELLWERAPWEPHNYSEILEVRSNEELQVMFGSAAPEGDDDDGGSSKADADTPY